jgi:hypothetical protein
MVVSRNNIYFLIFSVLLFFFVVQGSLQVYRYEHPIGNDPRYHFRLSKGWLSGENPLLNESYFLMNAPYPPAFQLSIAVFSRLFFTTPLHFMNLLQIILLPSALISFFYLAYKKTNYYTAVLSSCFLSSSIAFHDRVGQVIPQAVDAALFPIVLYFYMEKRSKAFVFLSAFLVYNHGVFAILLISSLFIYSFLYSRERLKEFGVIFVLSLPLFLIFIATASDLSTPFLSRLFDVTSPQHDYFIKYPFYGLSYLGYYLSIFSLVGLIRLGAKVKSDFDKILILWILVLLPLYFSLPDRFMSYAAQPLALISGMAMHGLLKSENKRHLLLGFSVLMAILYNLSYISHIGLIQWAWLDPLKKWLLYSFALVRT